MPKDDIGYRFTNNAENLVSYSTYNASTWSNLFPAGATLTTGISAPDGSTDAVRFSCNNTTNALLRVTIPTVTANGINTYTSSFFVKLISGTGNASTDLEDGNPTVNYSSQLVTNTWVRIQTSGVPTAGNKTFIDLFSDSNTNYVLDFWGVQLERKSSATAYVKTNGNIIPAGDGLVYDFYDVFVPAEIFRKPSLWVWGDNRVGQLGTNGSPNRSTPVTTFAGGTNWKSIAAGGQWGSGSTLSWYHTAIKTDGTLWVWGANNIGQLGINNTTGKSTPVTTSAGGTNWKSVACGVRHTAAIKTDGTLWTWGGNLSGEAVSGGGQLGTNDTTQRNNPVTTFAGGTNWKSVTCGGTHTAAIKTDGTLWTWGLGHSGRLGNASGSQYFLTPVTTFAGGTDWKQVSCGISYTLAIKTDGTLWVWGSNARGQLGINNTTDKSTPVTTFAGGTNWKSLSGGRFHTSAIKTDGTLWTWGSNDFGMLGDNTTTQRNTPVTTFAGGTNWKSLSASTSIQTAIKTDGSLWVWGANFVGPLGTNDLTQRNTPVTTFAGKNNWKQVAAGYDNIIAIEYEPDP